MPGEGAVQPALPGACGDLEQLAAGRGEPDQTGAAVGGVGAADDEPARLQLADLPADDRLAHPALHRELPEPSLALREQAGQLQVGERDVRGMARGVRDGVHQADDRLVERVHGLGRRCVDLPS